MDTLHKIAFNFGYVAVYLFMFIWIPLAGWFAGRAFKHSVQTMLKTFKTVKKDHRKPVPQKDPIPRRERKPKKLDRKAPKSDYPVVEGYRDEYKITNPVEF